MAHMKQANMRPKGRATISELPGEEAARALVKAADQKKTKRYMELSKTVVATNNAMTRVSERMDDSLSFVVPSGPFEDSDMP